MELLDSVDLLMRFSLALGLVIGLVALTVWLAKLFGFNPAFRLGRVSTARLKVVDSLVIDNKYKLVLVRRDQVEHLLCLGGQSDFVVEQGVQPKKTVVPPKFIKKIQSSEEMRNS